MARKIINAKAFTPDQKHMLQKFNLQRGGKVQAVVDNAVLGYSSIYMPMETGSLIARSYSATVVGSGEVVFPGPYAHYLYMGEVYGPNIPIFDDDTDDPTSWISPKGKKKHATGRTLNIKKDKNAQAQSHWVEVVKANHMNDIIDEARKAVKGK